MKNHYFLSILFFLSFCSVTIGQVNNKIVEDMPHQKTLIIEQASGKEDAIARFAKEFHLDADATFLPQKETEDRMGMKHQRYQQYYKGIKVEFGVLVTHSSNESVTLVNGELYNPIGLNLVPAITAAQGLDKAIAATPSKKYLWEDEAQSKIMEYHKPQGELVIFPVVITGEMKLAYKYDVYSMDPIIREEIYVDSHTGVILFRNPLIKHAHNLITNKEIEANSRKLEALVTGTAATKYSGSRSIETVLDTNVSKYVLQDNTRGGGIATYNCQNTNTYQDVDFQDNDNNWTATEFANAAKDNGALDAHWAAEMTYDFWKNIFGRKSVDDNNLKIKGYVHYNSTSGATTGYDNAFWNGSVMSYGDGSSMSILTSIDVCGHEIGHGICQYTAALAYQNQSGAMNEGYSDVWGACIEHYGRTGSLSGTPVANVWLIGEDLTSGGLRSMKSPNLKGNPSCFKGTYWTTTANDGNCTPTSNNDYCGVHNNSGVMNHWFYILSAGESGTNNAPVGQRDTYAVTGIGIAKAAEIAYLAERDYLTPNATYADARVATLTVAGNLYCASSPEYKAVTDSWFAVNVGTQYTAAANDVNIKSINKDINVSCNKSFTPIVTFENSGTNPITSVTVSYTIDGGTAVTSTWTGSLSVCTSTTFPLSIGTLTRGTHTLSVTTTIANDGNTANNTKSTFVIVNDAGIINQVNTFDAAADVLVSIDSSGSNNVWQRGTSAKTLLTNAVAGNSPVYATRLTGNYPDKTTSYLVSQCYDLTSISNPLVKFNMAYDLETNWDIIFMQYSTNSGQTWTNLGTGTSATWYTSSRLPDGTDCFNCIGGQWTGQGTVANPRGDGTNAKMREYSYSLSDFGLGGATPQSNIIFRFVFQSDDAVNFEGAIIDNFVIQGTVLSTTHNDFEQFSIYPNPSKGNIVLSLSSGSDVKVTLFDINGRLIYNKLYNNSTFPFTQELTFEHLSRGVYLINVESDGKKASSKLIIN